MNKIAIVTDTHFGARNGSIDILNNQKEFFISQFLPYLKENNIDTIIHAGDVFDNRKTQDMRIVTEWKNLIQKTLNDGFKWHIIIGNHDTYYKNTNSINSAELCLPIHKNLKIYRESTNVKINDIDMCFVSWINEENYEHTMSVINESKAKLCIGHLELIGFEYQKNSIATHGFEASIFSKFDKVLSGHYHTRSNKGNVYYLGCPYEMTWNEANQKLGFYTIDKTLNLTFIENNVKIFNTIYYNEDKPLELTEKLITGKFIKIYIDKREDLYKYDMWFKKLESFQPANISVIEPEFFNIVNNNELEFSIKSDDDLIISYVNNQTDFANKEELINFLIGLLKRVYENRKRI